MNAIFLLETDFWREIVVEKDDGPTSLIALLEWSETVLRKAKCNVTFIGKVEEWIGVISMNNGIKERPIMGAIENVLNNTRLMYMICSIAHLLPMCRVRRHSL